MTATERRQQAQWCAELANSAELTFAKEILTELAEEFSNDADKLEQQRPVEH